MRNPGKSLQRNNRLVLYTVAMANGKERTYFLLALLLGSAVLAFFVFRPFIATVALAAIFAVLLHPVQMRIGARLPRRPGVSAFLTLLIGLVFLLIPLSLVGALVVEQSGRAFGSLITNGVDIGGAAQAAGQWLEPHFPGATAFAESFASQLSAYAEQSIQWFVGRAGAAVTTVFDFLLQLIVFLFALYYLLRDGQELNRFLVRKSPLTDAEGESILKQLSLTVNSVVKGTLVIAVVQGTLAGIGYFLLGVPNAILWGVCTAVAALLPPLGTGFVLVPATLYLVFTGHIAAAVALSVWGIFVVSTIDNFLRPYLMSRGASLHPLVILLSVIGGLAFYGPAGIFLGPLTASFLYAVYSVYAKEEA